MAQGKKYNQDTKEKAFALLAENNNVAEVARTLNVPYTTVKTWEQQYIAKSKALEKKKKDSPEALTDEESYELDLVALRNQKKKEFIGRSWGSIEMIQTILERRLKRAMDSEDALDELLGEILSLDGKTLSTAQRQSLCMKMREVKVESVKELAVVLGTLYDKQALANKEATQIVDGQVGVRFEDL